jgi:hypothetical protein
MNTTELRTADEFRKRLERLNEAEIAWFSGWLCADGSIKVVDKFGRPAVRFQICDRDPLDRFADLFGNSVHGPFAQHAGAFGTRPVFEWRISGLRAVILLRRCRPWLSERYAERAISAMQYKTRKHQGRKLTPVSVARIKRELETGGHGIGRRLAKRYRVTDGLISAIKVGRVW